MSIEQFQTQTQILNPQERVRAKRLRGALTQLSLRAENVLYAHTRGISHRNRAGGFRPGYLHRVSGLTVLSRFGDGSLAPIHVLDGLPQSWVIRRDADGRVIEASPEIVSGFIRDGVFYTREEAMKAAAH
ncbi:hypothetical protein [Thiocystis violascens]|uniref:Uncharacterized protein n=1 Tax=Thiocystis violascens (strain ATCC 17096 / DSM 198 / 6111) TaxID=765911 RepID=I3YHB2_THIV6|nr:hypothetical protein [Thiocystis violascens]AFL76380.1 hypothetical protein Thivi_4588 [Thiocystis violascens DSM 198]